MKKLLCVLLTLVLLVGTVIPAFAANSDKYANVPIIALRGDADPIYSADGEKVFPVEIPTEDIPDMVAEVVYPYLIQAVLFNKWDAYYDAFEAEVNKYFGGCHLDDAGNASNGTDISPKKREQNEYNMTHDLKKSNGQYDAFAYTFWYDWRLDPYEIADELYEYINAVKKATGAKRVSLIGRCLGGSFIFAYFDKYGYDGIYNLALDATVGNGSEKFSDLVCGRVVFDAEAFEREQRDEVVFNPDDDSYEFSDYMTLINQLIVACIDLGNENGVLKLTEKAFAEIYEKVKNEMVPRLVMATYGTFPGYWTTVLRTDYATAREFIFNTDEKKFQYRKLLEKLDYYDVHVRQRISDILQEAKKADVDIGIVVKYGYQSSPFLEGRNLYGDSLISVTTASFGATVSKMGETLSDEYIKNRINNGFGSYISPDKIIDASTAQYPDSTWYIKGLSHNSWPTAEKNLLYKICTYRGQLTVTYEKDYPQFMIFDKETFRFKAMTADNSDVLNFDYDEVASHSLKDYFASVTNYFKSLFAFLREFIARQFNKD